MARTYLGSVLSQASEITYVRFGTLDSLAQVELSENNLAACQEVLGECATTAKKDRLPSRSWYDLAHQVTRCAYHERLEDWSLVIGICDDADGELARRQYKAVRTALLCAKARALARMDDVAGADDAIATAVRVCPRGAVDPLIVLEASKAVCLGLRGASAKASTHFDRALAACRAIGHRYHEGWIARQQKDVLRSRESVAVREQPIDTGTIGLILNDVSTILGAGHSIDLLAHRVMSILKSTSLANRLSIEALSGCEFQAEPSAAIEPGADGAFTLQVRGSDRQLTIRVKSVDNLDEISLLKGVADVVQAAINRTADTESEDDDQNLWPRTMLPGVDDMVFRSPRMQEILRVAVRLASTDLPVLITGETGTGKEILARMIHDHSRAKKGAFVPFNCAATPRDLVESQLFGHRRGAFTGATESFQGLIRGAEKGTLFLDEIGDLELAAQPKFLRFLESGEIHPVGDLRPQHVAVRVVAATNANLEALVEQGRFRSDLFYRVGIAKLSLPPLRERKDEIPALASVFLTRHAKACQRTGLKLSDDFIAALLLYDWPGNIRELSNEIRRVVAMASDGETITSAELNPVITARWNERSRGTSIDITRPSVQVRLDQTLAEATRELEARFIEHAMETSGGRVASAAQLLGLSRKGLFLKRRRNGTVGRSDTDGL